MAARVLVRLPTISEARIVEGLLRQNGILAYLSNAEHTSVDWWSIPALNGVGVMVPAWQIEPARKIIQETLEAVNAEQEPVPELCRGWRGVHFMALAATAWCTGLLLGWMDMIVWPHWVDILLLSILTGMFAIVILTGWPMVRRRKHRQSP